MVRGLMESELMSNRRSVTDRRRGSQRRVRKRGYLVWLCNPPVLKAIIAIARLIVELVTMHPRL